MKKHCETGEKTSCKIDESITESTSHRYDELTRANYFFCCFVFSSLYSGENCIWYICSLFITTWISLDISWITEVCLMLCWEKFVCWWYFIMIIDQQNVGTFSDVTCSSTTYFTLLYMEHQSIASFEHLLFFFFRLFYLSTRCLFVLILVSSVIY